MSEIIAICFVGLVILGVVSLGLWDYRRQQKRRATLRKEKDAGGSDVYFWIDYDGSTKQSDKHPEAPGGAWHSDSSDFGGGGVD